MTTKVLDGVKKIGGYEVEHIKPDPNSDRESPSKFVRIHHGFNTISIQLQDGPIREVGENGAQVDTFIHVAKELLIAFNQMAQHPENEKAIDCLSGAIEALDRRTKERISRNVEGTSKE